MKKICIVFFVVLHYSMLFGQEVSSPLLKFIASYNYQKQGGFLYLNDNPFDGINYVTEYGFRYYSNTSLGNDNGIALGVRIAPMAYFFCSLNISNSYYKYSVEGIDQDAEVDVSTYAPYLGLRLYYTFDEKVFPYFEIGMMKRFSNADITNYFSDKEFEKDYEGSLEDVTSPLAGSLIIGLDYNIYERVLVGMSTRITYEKIKGDAIARGDYVRDGTYEMYFYEFEESRIGQSYNLNLSIMF